MLNYASYIVGINRYLAILPLYKEKSGGKFDGVYTIGRHKVDNTMDRIRQL